MPEARALIHPGPVAQERITAAPCLATHRCVTLKAGSTLLAAMIDATNGAGAWFDLSDLPVKTLTFVRPAPAPDKRHVAWYSAETVLEDAVVLQAGAHLGQRDGAAFAHVHGLWSEGNGTRHAGHLLAEVTVLAEDHAVDVWVLEGAVLEAMPDAETGFTLFRPTETASMRAPNALLATIRPNMLIDKALARCFDASDLPLKTIKGLGSLVGTQLDGPCSLNDQATEVLLTETTGQEVITVGFDGPPLWGKLTPGANRVCVTFEVLLL